MLKKSCENLPWKLREIFFHWKVIEKILTKFSRKISHWFFNKGFKDFHNGVSQGFSRWGCTRVFYCDWVGALVRACVTACVPACLSACEPTTPVLSTSARTDARKQTKKTYFFHLKNQASTLCFEQIFTQPALQKWNNGVGTWLWEPMRKP